MFQGKHLILGVTGGIAVVKLPELISNLRKLGISVEVVMTKAATAFITPMTFREITHNPVHQELFTDQLEWRVEHISLAKKADAIAIIPATANVIAKLAHGIADDLLTTTVLAASCPKLVAPAMNSGMYQNPTFQKNLKMLIEDGYLAVNPETGVLLCGDNGPGRLANLETLEISIKKALSQQDLQDEFVLVTAGATREPIDPVRYLTNRSSGKMGHALAEAAWCRGARVMLVTTAANPPAADGLEVFTVSSTSVMREKVLELASKASLIIKAAAPADYRPQTVASQKIKKTGVDLNLKLIPNDDILAELGRSKTQGQLLVGFAAETESLATNALVKLEKKNLDLIIGNLVDQPHTGMGAERNRVTIYSRNEQQDLEELPKRELADRILDVVLKYKISNSLK